jgi:hypothetical protein
VQSKLTVTGASAVNDAIALDGYDGTSGASTINVDGTLASQTSCTSSNTSCSDAKCQSSRRR